MEGPGPETFFGRHAKDYRENPSHAHGPDLTLLIEALRPRKGDRALDVGTGTGHTALALAGLVEHVVGVDATREMLTEAGGLARERGVGNYSRVLGDAQSLGFRSRVFDLVTTRRATHHFPDPGAFVAEAARVLRPGGKLGVVDMCPPSGGAELQNTLERIRDPTHRKGLTDREWRAIRDLQGLTLEFERTLEEYMPFSAWLRPIPPGGREESEIRDALGHADPVSKHALGVRETRGTVEGFVKRRIVWVASTRRTSDPG